jgi:hypothetical protein
MEPSTDIMSAPTPIKPVPRGGNGDHHFELARSNAGDYHMIGRPQTPLQSIAQQMVRLVYADFMLMAKDIHSDGHTVGKSPAETADLLHAWAVRQLTEATEQQHGSAG